MPIYSSGGGFGGSLDKAGHGFTRLGAFAQPILGARQVKGEIVPLLLGLIRAEFLDAFAVARTAAVRHDDAKGRGVLGPDAFHSDFD